MSATTDPTPADRSQGSHRFRGLDWAGIGCIAVFALAAIATGLVWETAHDEGITWHQAVGPLRIPRWPAEPARVEELYAAVEGADEYTAGNVLESLMIQGGMHPPAYYLALHSWSQLVGTNRLPLTLPIYALGAVALWGMRRLATRLTGSASAGVWAMLLLAVSPWFVGFTNLARPYAVALCLSIGSLEILLAALRQPERRRWPILFGGISLLGIYTLYHYAFVAAAELLLWAGLSFRQTGSARRRSLQSLALATGILVLGFAPWLPRLLLHLEATAGDQHYFGGVLTAGEWPGRTLRLLSFLGLGEARIGPGASGMRTALYALGIVSLPLVVRSLRPGSLRELAPGARAAWLFGPIVAGLVWAADLWHGTHTLFVSKTSFWLLPVLILMIVRGWAEVSPPILRRAGLVAWVLLFAAATCTNIVLRESTADPYEVVASYLRRTDFPTHWVAFSSGTAGYAIPLVLELRRAGVERVKVVRVPRSGLSDFVAETTRNPSVRALSLINLAVSYRTEDVWTRKDIEATLEQAQAAGWSDRLVRPSAGDIIEAIGSDRWQEKLPDRGAEPPPLPRTRPFSVFSLTKVKYFSQ